MTGSLDASTRTIAVATHHTLGGCQLQVTASAGELGPRQHLPEVSLYLNHTHDHANEMSLMLEFDNDFRKIDVLSKKNLDSTITQGAAPESELWFTIPFN
jgi:hypothetical protein